jgi:hypothetical protein
MSATGTPPIASAIELFDTPSRPGQGISLRAQLPSLLLNAVAPVIAYQVLTDLGVDSLTALASSAIFPVLGTGLSFARTRRPDIIGVVSLTFILIGVATSLLSGDPRFVLVKDSLMTGVFGLLCLGSLVLVPRPLLFYFGRQFSSAGDPARAAAFESMWQYPQFRAAIRVMTIAWGVGYLIEALVRVGLSFVLPIPVFLMVSPLLASGVTIGLIGWTVTYARTRTRRRAAELARVSTGPASGHERRPVRGFLHQASRTRD